MSDSPIELAPERGLAVVPDRSLSPLLTAAEMTERVEMVRTIRERWMKEGIHYGKLPGCGDRLVLLKAGAEILLMGFNLTPRMKVHRSDLPDGHREYETRCIVYNASGRVVGEGVGTCSTMESKYRWRQATRLCPKCGQPAIIKGRQEYGGGWLCFEKKGGCKAKFADGDREIEGQQVGRVANPDIADTYNTVLKMSKKRSMVDAAITATATSEMFTQDLDEEPPDDPPGDHVDRRTGEVTGNGARQQNPPRTTATRTAPPANAAKAPAKSKSEPPARDLRKEARAAVQRIGTSEATRICKELGVESMQAMLGQPADLFASFVDQCQIVALKSAAPG